jgi:hypothetical protein
MCVEMCFGLLKSKWRILKYPLEQKTIETKAHIVAACIALHNLIVNEEDNIVNRMEDFEFDTELTSLSNNDIEEIPSSVRCDNEYQAGLAKRYLILKELSSNL